MELDGWLDVHECVQQILCPEDSDDTYQTEFTGEATMTQQCN